eukprot:Tbor_TRINITY_DN5500_c6_g1::TRINITY_DN5500_c6_g1_i2::g.12844::m.12844
MEWIYKSLVLFALVFVTAPNTATFADSHAANREKYKYLEVFTDEDLRNVLYDESPEILGAALKKRGVATLEVFTDEDLRNVLYDESPEILGAALKKRGVATLEHLKTDILKEIIIEMDETKERDQLKKEAARAVGGAGHRVSVSYCVG